MYVDILNSINHKQQYRVFYADPPWQYSDKGCNGACEGHYSTMKIEDICKLPVKELAHDDAVLFLWVTYPMLLEGLRVIEAWGFKYKTLAFQWIKENKSGEGYFMGLGRWTRGNSEACLLAIKGKPHKYVQKNGIRQLIVSPVEKHSKKPIEARKRIEDLLSPSEQIELFAREKAENWDYWGNEVLDKS